MVRGAENDTLYGQEKFNGVRFNNKILFVLKLHKREMREAKKKEKSQSTKTTLEKEKVGSNNTALICRMENSFVGCT